MHKQYKKHEALSRTRVRPERFFTFLFFMVMQTLFLACSYLASLNIEKLQLTSVTLQNATSEKQRIIITTKTKDGLSDNHHSIEPYAYNAIECEGEIITSIEAPNAAVGYTTNDPNFPFVCKITTPSLIPDFPIAVPFEEAIKQDPGLQHVITKTTPFACRRYPQGVTPLDFFNHVKQLYEASIGYLTQPEQATPRIPLTIHVIWFGKPLPKHYAQWHKEWKKRHAGWHIICWTEELLQQAFPNGLVNQATFEQARQATNYAKMSDIARYEILYNYGGLYVDFDAKNFEDFTPLHYAYDFYTGLEEVHAEMEAGNAVIGSCPGHPLIKACIDMITQYQQNPPDLQQWDISNPRITEINHTLVTTGPVMLTHALWHHAGKHPKYRDIILPSLYFYCSSHVHPASFCKHHFFDTWVNDITC